MELVEYGILKQVKIYHFYKVIKIKYFHVISAIIVNISLRAQKIIAVSYGIYNKSHQHDLYPDYLYIQYARI